MKIKSEIAKSNLVRFGRLDFLPVSKADMKDRGWDSLDVILVTGDAYVDHPSYGAAVIGRVLENAGFKVGIIAQPDIKDPADIKRLGRPKLFFGISSGNLDSLIANYTANKLPRSDDEYSPGGKSGLRPDRATIFYANKVREAFAEAPIVIGGMEAGMRRLAHYDYWQDKVRRSILLDSKADILVYGMGEKQVLEIAGRLAKGEKIDELSGIPGTCVIRNSTTEIKDPCIIPSFEEISTSTVKFNSSLKTAYFEANPVSGRTLAQKHGSRFVIQFPPPAPLTTGEMDQIYGLAYKRAWHPSYNKEGGVPGFETVKFSVISHRGCPGACNFCSLYFHQGRIVQSRSEASILAEIKDIASQPDFKGTITDIGGPTANLYGADCELWNGPGPCKSKKCLNPEKCPGLNLGYEKSLKLWEKVLTIPGVKRVFAGSGLRYDLLVDKASDAYLKALCASHISGRLKVAPEHTSPAVLGLMSKPDFKGYRDFVKRFDDVNRECGKEQYLVNYFIIGHPGAGLKETLDMALELEDMGIHPEQVQDFIPLPMTVSGAMYYTGIDPFNGKPVYVAKGSRERKLQRALIQHKDPENKKYVIEALRKLERMDAIGKLLPSLRG